MSFKQLRVSILHCYAQHRVPQFQHSGILHDLFFFLEPMGSAAPKVNLKLKAIDTSINEKLALVCPAQGMPLPAFR